MPHHTRCPLGRCFVIAMLTALLATVLTSCTGASAARTAGERYVNLIATADAAQLEELWAMTATDTNHRGLRAAGELLPGAAERIEVLDVGDATEYQEESGEGLPSYPTSLDSDELVQVPVRYELGGAEHDATVVLAPRRDRPAGDPESWRVVRPLTRDLGVSEWSNGLGKVADIYVSGIRVMTNTSQGGYLDTSYPGVYEVQLRADPYLASKNTSITVTPGIRSDVPVPPLNGTPAAQAILQKQVLAMFTRCEADVDECPAGVSQLSRELSRSDWNVDSWRFKLISPPTKWTVQATKQGLSVVRYTGGRFTLSYVDGTRRTIQFNATTNWRFDSDPPTPQLRAHETRIEVIP